MTLYACRKASVKGAIVMLNSQYCEQENNAIIINQRHSDASVSYSFNSSQGLVVIRDDRVDPQDKNRHMPKAVLVANRPLLPTISPAFSAAVLPASSQYAPLSRLEILQTTSDLHLCPDGICKCCLSLYLREKCLFTYI